MQACSNDVSRGGSSAKTYNTTNLINHLKKDHLVDFKDYEKKKVQELKEKDAAEKNASMGGPKQVVMKQISLEETEARAKPWEINDPRAVWVYQKIAEMMALDFLPYSIVTNEGFSQLLKTLEPRYTLPN